MTYEEDVRILARLCKKCGGRCCFNESDITISEKELETLKNYDFEQGILTSPYGIMNTIKIPKNEVCPFLGRVGRIYSQRGCILKGKRRPLSCRLYPIVFLVSDDYLTFFLSGFCPYVHQVARLKTWIRESIEDARKELQTWTLREKLCRSHWHQIHKNLIPINVGKST